MKKHMKKIWALLLIAVMVMGMSVTALAADQTYSITIQDALKGETYTAYKIFDVEYSGSAYAYSIRNTSAAGEWFDDLVSGVTAETNGDYILSAYGLKLQKTTTDGLYNVVVTDADGIMTDAHAEALAAFLYTKTAGKTEAGHASEAFVSGTDDYGATTTLTIDVDPDEAGYYFVTTTEGSLCLLDTTDPTAVIHEKNSQPTVAKTVAEAANGTFGADAAVDIGDLVYYQIVVTDGTGTDVAITVHDALSAGQTLLIGSFAVSDNDSQTGTIPYTVTYDSDHAVEGTAGTNVQPDTAQGAPALADGETFSIIFPADYIASLGNGKAITITYQARLNASAAVASTGNTNSANITYSAQTSADSTATVYTYAAAIYKVDGSNASEATELSGAAFSVQIGGQDAYFTAVSAGSASAPAVYRYNSQITQAADGYTKTVVTPESGAVVFIGLDEGTELVLTETEEPTGYNRLTGTTSVTVASTHAATADKTATTTAGAAATFVAGTDDAGYQIKDSSIVIIENLSGSVLPSTGGIGTMPFYIVGAVLVIGAVVVLMVRRRMRG